MKRHQFRLEAVLKVRRMHEEAARNALGALMVERQGYLDLIATLNSEIDHAYRGQEAAMGKGMRACQAAFFPVLVEGKHAHIKHVEGQVADVDARIEVKRAELNARRAELKAVEKLKEKSFAEWRKAANKEMDQKVEEMVQLWDMGRKAAEEA